MSLLAGNSRLPHSMRFVVFLLRLALGLDFLYLGLSTLFEPTMRHDFAGRSLGDLYGWLSSVSNLNSLQTVFAWIFLIVGACLMLGFLTRLISLVGIGLTAFSFFPMGVNSVGVGTFVSDGILVIICLVILFVANAGTYLGIDSFFHFRVGGKHEG